LEAAKKALSICGSAAKKLVSTQAMPEGFFL